MRLIFFLLVFANLLFFAWTQGYLGSADDGREPQRLEQELHPNKLRIVAKAPVPGTNQEVPVCRVINGLKLAEAEAFRTALAAAGGEATILPIAEPELHLVVVGDLSDKAAADKKNTELTKLGVEGYSPVALADGRYEFVLGSFPTDAAAREFLQGLTKRGIKLARVDLRQQPPVKARAEARAPAAKLLQQLPKLIAPYAEATIGECAP